jgi:hypothetical protein
MKLMARINKMYGPGIGFPSFEKKIKPKAM